MKLLSLTLLVGAIIATGCQPQAAYDPTKNTTTQMAMQHPPLDISNLQVRPEVTLNIQSDSMSGVNIFVETTNFIFTPEHAGQKHQPNEGHAHLYVDGEKVARMYGPWYHYDKLLPGTHQVQVTLNTNDHQEYAVGTTAIADSVTITIDNQGNLIN